MLCCIYSHSHETILCVGGAGGRHTSGHEGAAGRQEAELQATMAHLAELALLGAGASARMFPSTVEDWMATCADEQEFRVAL